MLLSLYAGTLHVFFVDGTGALRVRFQPPGGFTGGQAWQDDPTLNVTGLDPTKPLVGAQFNGQQHVFCQRPDGTVVHAFQSLTGQPSFAWASESL